jgi:hypothetical protein
MEFKIGDRVVVRDYNNIPENIRSKSIAKLHGQKGAIIDRLYSESAEDYTYIVQFDGSDKPSIHRWLECELWTLAPTAEYSIEFTYAENLVVARLYELGDDSKTEIGRGHGHIFHDGALGIAQAASYAMKKLYERMNGGNYND